MDFKRLIAYSSVAHMGLVPLGLFTHTIEGLVAAVFMMLAHGFVSSALLLRLLIYMNVITLVLLSIIVG